ncbi:MAG: hypothetical protein JRN45_02875 [Nitrososphaerota archaeon]|nr:hypothetical protein [Nitrososphaerota archaeon]
MCGCCDCEPEEHPIEAEAKEAVKVALPIQVVRPKKKRTQPDARGPTVL